MDSLVTFKTSGYTIQNGDEKSSEQPNQYEYVQREDL